MSEYIKTILAERSSWEGSYRQDITCKYIEGCGGICQEICKIPSAWGRALMKSCLQSLHRGHSNNGE